MKIRYVGFGDSVMMTTEDGPDLVFVHGEPIEVDDVLAKALIEQSNFEEVVEKKPAPKTK